MARAVVQIQLLPGPQSSPAGFEDRDIPKLKIV
jgi:hypothetical protein